MCEESARRLSSHKIKEEERTVSYFDDFDPDAEERRAYDRRRAAGGKKYSCPTCKEPNRLTKYENRQGYQCDECADKAESGIPGF